MAKRKVIKFVYQGRRAIKQGEFFLSGKNLVEWLYDTKTFDVFDVYHRIETEEEVPRWRAKVGGEYYYASMYYDICANTENRSILDGMLYDADNYFQTEEQAQEYIDHCKTFFENN